MSNTCSRGEAARISISFSRWLQQALGSWETFTSNLSPAAQFWGLVAIPALFFKKTTTITLTLCLPTAAQQGSEKDSQVKNAAKHKARVLFNKKNDVHLPYLDIHLDDQESRRLYLKLGREQSCVFTAPCRTRGEARCRDVTTSRLDHCKATRFLEKPDLQQLLRVIRKLDVITEGLTLLPNSSRPNPQPALRTIITPHLLPQPPRGALAAVPSSSTSCKRTDRQISLRL